VALGTSLAMISETELWEKLPPAAALEILRSNLSQGLHAAAQPLTLLRVSLGNGHINRLSKNELRELAATSALQVERVCSFFSCLQQLVITESIKPQLCPTPILPLLAYVIDGVNLLYEKDGVSLRSTVPETCQPVLIDRTRTRQALSSVLLIAHGLSRAQDTVEVIASSSDVVRIVVRNVKSSVNAMDAETSLSMALAEASFRSQQARFSWNLQPFSVQIELQKAPFGRQN
jgi:hypothetical protein